MCMLGSVTRCRVNCVLRTFDVRGLLGGKAGRFRMRAITYGGGPVLALNKLAVVPSHTVSRISFDGVTTLLLPNSST